MSTAETAALTTLKGDFGDANWATFIHEDNFPNWEADLRLADFNTLVPLLKECGFNAKKTPAMANALLSYFEKKRENSGESEDELPTVRKRSEGQYDSYVDKLKESALTATIQKDDPVELYLVHLPKNHQFVSDVQALTSATTSNNIVDFHMPNSEPSLDQGLYIRSAYGKLLADVIALNSPRCIVTGTPGIGKTAFRYYVLRQWVHNDPCLVKFDSIAFDAGHHCFLISRSESGALSFYRFKNSRNWDGLQSVMRNCLGLLEPSDADNNRQHTREMSLSIWTASPGAADANLKEMLKMGKTKQLVLPEWGRDEVNAAFGKKAVAAMEKFGGVPRLLELSVDEACVKVMEAVNVIGGVFSGLRLEEKSRLAHRLLLLDSAARPREFLSPWVARQIFKQHADTIRSKSKELATTLNQLGWAGTMVGMFFEPMFHDHVITKKSITIDKTTYAIKANQSVTIGHSKPPAELDTLYLPASRVNDTFDSYFLHCATGGGRVRLILVQVTIGATHTGGSFKGAVKKVYDAARDKWKASNVELWMVYAVPKGSAFDRKDMSMKNVKKADQPKISYKTIEAPFDFQLDASK